MPDAAFPLPVIPGINLVTWRRVGGNFVGYCLVVNFAFTLPFVGGGLVDHLRCNLVPLGFLYAGFVFAAVCASDIPRAIQP